MEFRLESSSSRIALLAVCALVASLFCYEAVRLELAEHRIWSDDLAKMQSAAALEPGYAEYWDRLGRFMQFGLDEQNLPDALHNYETAVKISPLTARYWIDLAIAHENLGETEKARKEFDQARKDYPGSAEVRWEYSNFLLRQGQVSDALKEMRTAVQEDYSLLPLAINRSWRATNDPDEVADAVLPSTAAAYIEALNFFAGEENVNAGLKIWRRLADSHQPFEIERLYPFLDVAIQQNRGADGKRMWLEALAARGLPHDIPADGSVVLNGGFEHDILNGGFDWRYEKQQSVVLTLDPSDFHGGHRSLLITFDGPGVTDAGIRQFIAVRPDTLYEFSAYYKNGEIEGAGAPHLTIQDFYTKAVLYDSDELKEAGFWKSATGDFTTGADTKLVVLHVRRLPEGSPIRGKLWVDDFRLVPKRP